MPFIRLTVAILAVAFFAISPLFSSYVNADETPPSAATSRITVDSERITIILKNDNAGQSPIYSWRNLPAEFREAVKSEPSLEKKTFLIVSRMQKLHEAGNKESTSGLGIFHIFGFGVPQNFERAEKLIRDGDKKMQMTGLLLLSGELLTDKEREAGLIKASDLTAELLEQDTTGAISHGNYVLYYLGKKADATSRKNGERIIAAMLKIDPDNAQTLCSAARFRTELKGFPEAWDLATRALQTSDLTPELESKARMIRIEVGSRAGKGLSLKKADYMEVIPYAKKLPKGILTTIYGVVAALIILVSWLFIFLTKRSSGAGPGLIVTIGWIIFGMIGATLSAFIPATQVLITGAILIAMVLGIRGELRKVYFPVNSNVSIKQVGVTLLILVGCILLTFVVGYVYVLAFQAISGQSKGEQDIAAYLKADSVGSYLKLILTFAIFIPAIEEIAYRGFLLDWTRRRFSWLWSILIVSIVFGLVHGLDSAVQTGFIGLVAAWLRLKTGNLWAAFLFHALNNGIAITVLSFGSS